MKKTLEELWNEFLLELNTSKIESTKILNSKSTIEDYKNFAKFIKINNCKIKGDKNNG